MLLIFLSSAWFSLLRGSLGSLRFFSSGTSVARGWRCPTGAGGTVPEDDDCPEDDPLPPPVCAMAVPPSRTRSGSATKIILILVLHSVSRRFCFTPPPRHQARADRGEHRRNSRRYDSAFPIPLHDGRVRYFAQPTHNSVQPEIFRRRREYRAHIRAGIAPTSVRAVGASIAVPRQAWCADARCLVRDRRDAGSRA